MTSDEPLATKGQTHEPLEDPVCPNRRVPGRGDTRAWGKLQARTRVEVSAIWTLARFDDAAANASCPVPRTG